jgi:acyl-coenzyme A thioesterase PaaI-like protein
MLIGKGKATFAVDLPGDFTGADGVIHGGLLTIIMDSIFGLSVFTALDKLKPVATINLRSDYLADAAPGERVICDAECYEIRNEVAFVAGRVTTKESGLLLASGSGAFMVGTRGISKGSRL